MSDFHNKRKLLDNFGGLHEFIYCDDDVSNARTLIKTYQDCTPIIEENKILADEPPGEDFRLVARFPIIFADKAMREGWFNDGKKWDDLCNDPDYAAFRVWKGRM